MNDIFNYLLTIGGCYILSLLLMIPYLIIKTLFIKAYIYAELVSKKILNSKICGIKYYFFSLVSIVAVVLAVMQIKIKSNMDYIYIICTIIFCVINIRRIKTNLDRELILARNEILEDEADFINKDIKFDFGILLGGNIPSGYDDIGCDEKYNKFLNRYIGFKYDKYYLPYSKSSVYLDNFILLKKNEILIKKSINKLKRIRIKRKLDDEIYEELAKIIVFSELSSFIDFPCYFLNRITAYNIYLVNKEYFMSNIITSYYLLYKMKVISKESMDRFLVDLYSENGERLSFRDSIAILKHFKFNLDISDLKNSYKNNKEKYVKNIAFNLDKACYEKHNK